MATSHFATEQYTSEAFVESVGTVLFRMSTQETCVLHFWKKDEYLLAKGRRSCGDSRQDAAGRELTEDCGFPCRLLHVNMFTRAPCAIEDEQLDDEARLYTEICEPFLNRAFPRSNEGVTPELSTIKVLPDHLWAGPCSRSEQHDKQ
ncbi:MAG: hypothetical protein L6R36_007034 [Xanthoria steineri]|nr:MAG: hypothetical protein L6R36_007034 [Xanthoria steineri]